MLQEAPRLILGTHEEQGSEVAPTSSTRSLRSCFWEHRARSHCVLMAAKEKRLINLILKQIYKNCQWTFRKLRKVASGGASRFSPTVYSASFQKEALFSEPFPGAGWLAPVPPFGLPPLSFFAISRSRKLVRERSAALTTNPKA